MTRVASLAAVAAALMLSTGCMKVIEGDKTFSVQASKFIIGKDLQDAEAKVPAGATITTVMVSRTLFGLVQSSVISGTK